MLIESFKGAAADWKKPVQVIAKLIGKSSNTTIVEIEKSRQKDSILAMENRALTIENESLFNINQIERAKSEILLKEIEELNKMSLANDQMCSRIEPTSAVLKALQVPVKAPKSEFLQKIDKLQQNIDYYEHKMQQKHDIW